MRVCIVVPFSYAAVCLLAATTPAFAATTGQQVPVAQPRITLVEHPSASGETAKPDASSGASSDPRIARLVRPGKPTLEAYRFLETIHAGSKKSEIVEIAFHGKTTLESFSATNDFHVLPGGSCREHQTYQDGESCTVDVEFAAKGPGKRAGRLLFHTAESATPESVGIQGNTSGPALAFTPAQITTLPQTYAYGAYPQLWIPGDVIVDEGDNLYYSDVAVGGISSVPSLTPSGAVNFIDDSGALVQIAGQGTKKITLSGGFAPDLSFLQQPVGLATDPFLELYIAESGNNAVDIIAFESISPEVGLGAVDSTTCTKAKPCSQTGIKLETPYWITLDDAFDAYFNDANGYYISPESTQTVYITSLTGDEFFDQDAVPFGLDSSQNLYAMVQPLVAPCEISGNPGSGTGLPWITAGDGICGYAGDDVRSQHGELGNTIGGYAFDQAGNMYIADSANNVLRRIDTYNGLIHTIGGNYALGAGFSGDGAPGTDATLNFPWGVAVDSNGVIYTASYVAGATGITPQLAMNRKLAVNAKPAATATYTPAAPDAVIRQLGPNGQRVFPGQVVTKASPAMTITLSNVGNDDLIVNGQTMGGANPGDFSVDPVTTTCNWSTPLPAGRSCQLGYIFRPSATGVRSATVTFADNTATFQNTILLSGAGVAAALTPTIKLTGVEAGTQYPPGTVLPLVATVTNGIAPPNGPTGVVRMLPTQVSGSGKVTDEADPMLNNQGVATANLKLPGGVYALSARYNGDAADAAVTSGNYLIAILPVPPKVLYESPVNNAPFPYGTAIPIKGVVTDQLSEYLGVASYVTGSSTFVVTNLATSKAVQTIVTPAPAGNNTTANFTGSATGLPVGSYSVAMTFNGDSQNGALSALATGTFTVTQATPTITWATPATVVAGTKLSATQLDATATLNGTAVPGKFVYTPPAGTVLSAGKTTLNVTFTPTDTTDLKTATGSVVLVVDAPAVKPATVTSLASIQNPVKLGSPVEVRTTVRPTTGETLPSGTVTIREGSLTLATGKLVLGNAAISVVGLKAGTHTLTAEYSGDADHTPSTSKPIQQQVVIVAETPLRSL